MVKTYEMCTIEVEAIMWTGQEENVTQMYNFLEGASAGCHMDVKDRGKNFYIDFCNGGCQMGDLMIKTAEGFVRAHVGDYVIKDASGSYYPCKPSDFEADFKVVE